MIHAVCAQAEGRHRDLLCVASPMPVALIPPKYFTACYHLFFRPSTAVYTRMLQGDEQNAGV